MSKFIRLKTIVHTWRKARPNMFKVWPSLLLIVASADPGRSRFPAPIQVSYSIERELPHDATCFTEGLFIRGGALYESCGLNGKSKLVKYAWPPNPGELSLLQQRTAMYFLTPS